MNPVLKMHCVFDNFDQSVGLYQIHIVENDESLFRTIIEVILRVFKIVATGAYPTALQVGPRSAGAVAGRPNGPTRRLV